MALTEFFWVSVLTAGTGLIITLAKIFQKSRCSEVSLCCLKIIRDTDAEKEEYEFGIRTGQIPLPPPPSPSISNV
tara:strand:+ start:6313 stop:6537 length:225 start_codon:yes stop_codon:yes gene_type:complete